MHKQQSIIIVLLLCYYVLFMIIIVDNTRVQVEGRMVNTVFVHNCKGVDITCLCTFARGWISHVCAHLQGGGYHMFVDNAW